MEQRWRRYDTVRSGGGGSDVTARTVWRGACVWVSLCVWLCTVISGSSSSPVVLSGSLLNLQAAVASSARNIRHMPCVSRKTGETGTCMFAIDCLKANGSHLGTCIDRFYFGSCCRLPEPDLLPQIEDNTIFGNYDKPFVKPEGDNVVRPLDIVSETPSTTVKTTPKTPKPTTVTHPPTPSQATTIKRPNTPTILTTTTVAKPTTNTEPPLKLSTFQSVNSQKTQATTAKPLNITRPVTLLSIPTNNQPTSNITVITMKPANATILPIPTSPVTVKPIITFKPTFPAKITPRPLTRPTPVNIPDKTPVSIPTPLNATTTAIPIKIQTTPSTTAKPPTPIPTPTITHVTIASIIVPTRQKPTPTPNVTQIATSTIKPTTKPIISTITTLNLTKKPVSFTTTTSTKPEELNTTLAPVKTTQSPPKIPPSIATPKPTTAPTTPKLSTTITPTTTTTTTTTTTATEKPTPTSTNTNKLEASSRPASTTGKPGFVTWTSTHQSTTFKPTTVRQNATSEGLWSPLTTPEGWVLVSTEPTPTSTTRATPSRPTATIGHRPTTPRPIISTVSSSSAIPTTAVKPSSASPTPTTTPSKPSTPSSPSTPPTLLTSPANATKTSNVTLTTSASTLANFTSTTPSTVSNTTTAIASNTSDVTSSTTQKSTVSPIEAVTSPGFTAPGVNMSDFKDVCGRRLWPEARIVGGAKSTFGKWPWQISLRQWKTSTYLHKCGAALLNENWAITAAHCVDSVPPSDLLLRMGEYDLASDEEPYGFQERRVQIVASHPQFDPRTFEYDLALLRFHEPVIFQPNIIPVCVPGNDDNYVGKTAYVTGWGRLYEDGPLPSILQEVSVPVINNSVCETMYRSAGFIEHIPNIFICAGWRKGGFDSCEGDSGGPMVLRRDPDDRFVLAGVISWGIGCAEPNQPGVYTRISEFRDWINQILQF